MQDHHEEQATDLFGCHPKYLKPSTQTTTTPSTSRRHSPILSEAKVCKSCRNLLSRTPMQSLPHTGVRTSHHKHPGKAPKLTFHRFPCQLAQLHRKQGVGKACPEAQGRHRLRAEGTANLLAGAAKTRAGSGGPAAKTPVAKGAAVQTSTNVESEAQEAGQGIRAPETRRRTRNEKGLPAEHPGASRSRLTEARNPPRPEQRSRSPPLPNPKGTRSTRKQGSHQQHESWKGLPPAASQKQRPGRRSTRKRKTQALKIAPALRAQATAPASRFTINQKRAKKHHGKKASRK